MRGSVLLFMSAGALAIACAAADNSRAATAPAIPVGSIVTGRLPPPPAGTTELRFSEMFQLPVGPRGLEPTQKLLELNGKRVRLVGYVVRQEDEHPSYLILSPLPVSAPDPDDGPADDFPPQIVFVHLPAPLRDRIGGAGPQLRVFEGVLELGPHDEDDGRTSNVRLNVEPPTHERRPHARAKPLKPSISN